MVIEIPENCMDVQNALHLYVGADLEAEVQVAVARHLDGCANCRARATEAQAARAALLGLAVDVPLTTSVWSDVRAQLIREGRIASAAAPRRTPWWIIPAAAAASVAAVLVTLALNRDVSPLQPTPSLPNGPAPIVLHPVDPGAAPLYDDALPSTSPFDSSFTGASAAGNESRRVFVPADPNEIIR
ncbi:MAG: zf-HC2 domain-containing protein [Planctomycetes bacterium]|nr:zf-HC2 domain-containing protein [Planctomycetota bacterium]